MWCNIWTRQAHVFVLVGTHSAEVSPSKTLNTFCPSTAGIIKKARDPPLSLTITDYVKVLQRFQCHLTQSQSWEERVYMFLVYSLAFLIKLPIHHNCFVYSEILTSSWENLKRHVWHMLSFSIIIILWLLTFFVSSSSNTRKQWRENRKVWITNLSWFYTAKQCKLLL